MTAPDDTPMPHDAPDDDATLAAPGEAADAGGDTAAADTGSDATPGSGEGTGIKTGFTRGEKIRFAIYGILLIIGLGILTWQLVRDEPREPIVLGLFVASDEDMRAASTLDAPIYWLGPDPLPTATKVTAALPGGKRTEITQNLRGAFLYQSLTPQGKIRDELDAPYATVYTRTIDGPTRYNITKTTRECAQGKCPGGLTKITGEFGVAFVESNSAGGWMARIERDGALVFVSAGKPLMPAPTLMDLRPFDEEPLSDVQPKG